MFFSSFWLALQMIAFRGIGLGVEAGSSHFWIRIKAAVPIRRFTTLAVAL
jgi:hypothetical protein